MLSGLARREGATNRESVSPSYSAVVHRRIIKPRFEARGLHVRRVSGVGDLVRAEHDQPQRRVLPASEKPLRPIIAVVEEQLDKPRLLPALERLMQHLGADRRLGPVVGDAVRLPEVGDHAVRSLGLDHGGELAVRQLLSVQAELIRPENVVPIKNDPEQMMITFSCFLISTLTNPRT